MKKLSFNPKHSFKLLRKAFVNTVDEMLASLQLLLIITLVLALIYYVVEGLFVSGGGKSFWHTIVYFFSLYVEDPASIGSEGPVTMFGKTLVTLVGYVGVLIFAIPAGLVACGFGDAMREEARKEELIALKNKLTKAFRSRHFKSLDKHLESKTASEDKKLQEVFLIPSKRAVEWIQANKGMSEQNIFDTVNEFPEFRIVNHKERFFVEHFPVNRPYGCFINRKSSITIVVPSAYSEMGMGWFGYYVAKLGGFNFISKEIEVDVDDTDSFYNMKAEPVYNGKPEAFYKNSPKDSEALDVLEKKKVNRKAFLDDLKTLANECKDGHPWIIPIVFFVKSDATKDTDFHFASNNNDNTDSTVLDTEKFSQLFERFSTYFKATFEKDSVMTTRYPLLKNNLLYRLRDDYMNDIQFNGFVLRPSNDIVRDDDRRECIMYEIARLFNEVLAPGSSVCDDEIDDFKSGLGYDAHKGIN